LGLSLTGSREWPQITGSLVWRETEPLYRMRVRTDGSYASAMDSRVLIGLGDDDSAQSIGVRWPDGTIQRFGPLEVDRYHVLQRASRIK